MATRAGINILGSTGAIIDITSLGVSDITSTYSNGAYRVLGTLGMVPPPLGWGYVVNQMDLDKTVTIEYSGAELRVFVQKDGEAVLLEHSITLHVAVEELPPLEMPPETTQVSDPKEDAMKEYTRLRSHADFVIAPLQDAVDIDEATEQDIALLKVWKKYRVALNRVTDQAGYPNSIDWPVVPA